MGKRFGTAAGLLGYLAVAVLGYSLVGCTSTSEGFKVTAAAGGPYLANTTRQYVEKDTAASPQIKSERLADTAALLAATSNRPAIDVDTTAAAWQKVKPVFFGYTDSDAGLNFRPAANLPTMRETVQQPGRQMDEAITLERNRRSRLMFGGS
jgi:hypothetical protein